MRHNTFYFLVKKIEEEIKLASFKAKWRKNNNHNLTVPQNVFPEKKVEVGKYTYGNLECIFYGSSDNIEHIKIGNACSIANGTRFIAGGEHEMRMLTMFPYYQKYINKNDYQAHSKGPIIVEDEVWIGRDCIVLSGVTIGKGAVVGAGSLVAKDLPPYSIAFGVPAKIAKYRFSPDIVDKLLEIEYSNFDIKTIKMNPEIFREIIKEDNVDQLIEKLRRL